MSWSSLDCRLLESHIGERRFKHKPLITREVLLLEQLLVLLNCLLEDIADIGLGRFCLRRLFILLLLLLHCLFLLRLLCLLLVVRLFEYPFQTVQHHLHNGGTIQRFVLFTKFSDVTTQLRIEPFEFRVAFEREYFPHKLFERVMVDVVDTRVVLLPFNFE